MNALEDVAHLMRLFSRCSLEELEAAVGGERLSPKLRECLYLLHRVKQHHEIKRRRARSTRGTRSRNYDSSSRQVTLVGSLRRYGKRVERVFFDLALFPSNQSLADHLNDIGLGVHFRQKDGRNGMLGMFSRAFEKLGRHEMGEALKKLFSILPESETAGWFRTIRGED